MKNLKQQYEKVNDIEWNESLGKEANDRRLRRLRKSRLAHQHRLDKKSRRVRLTWE